MKYNHLLVAVRVRSCLLQFPQVTIFTANRLLHKMKQRMHIFANKSYNFTIIAAFH